MSGKQGMITEVDIFRREGGKVVERWKEFDMLGMQQQLGVVSPPRKVRE